MKASFSKIDVRDNFGVLILIYEIRQSGFLFFSPNQSYFIICLIIAIKQFKVQQKSDYGIKKIN